MRVRARVCVVCGSNKSSGSWGRIINDDGNWTGEWRCNKCRSRYYNNLPDSHNNVKKIMAGINKEKYLRERDKRICIICGTDKMFQSCKYYDKNGVWDGKSWLCKICYMEDYNRNSPKGYDNTLKPLMNCRTKIIDLSRFDNISDKEKGTIIEEIVCRTIKVGNRNIGDNNFGSETDTYRHPIYGYVEIKGRTLRIDKKWDFGGIQNKKSDTLIIVCMDRNEPWKNVDRVYIIPMDELFDITGITIYKDTRLIVSKWEKFRIDEGPFNDTWHNMKDNRYLNINC